MHVFCSYSCAVNRKIVPKATTSVFLGYAQSGYRCYDVKSKRLDVSLMLSLMEMESPHIFLNLINQPRGRMMMEMYCGLLLFINFFLILLQLMLRISLTLQASSFLLGGDYSLFPRVRLLQKISSLAQLLPFQSPPQILDPSLRFVDPLKFLILLKDFDQLNYIVFPKRSSLPHVSSIFS